MKFRVRIYDANQQTTVVRELDAIDSAAASASIAMDGQVVLSIVPTRARWPFASGNLALLKRRFRFDIRLFCEEVRTLLSAGMSLVEILDTLSTKSRDTQSTPVLRDLQMRLLEGKTFSAALEATPMVFPLVLVAAVRASERTGRVQDALEEYLRYESVLRDLQRKVLNAGIYPGLVILFGLTVGTFLLAYVVPRFAKVYDDFAQNLSVPTQVLIEIGRFVGSHVASLIIAAFVVFSFVWWLAMRGILTRALLSAADRVGPIQRVLYVFQLSRIYQTMAMLIRGGYPVIEAAGLARSLAFQERLRASVDVARQSIAEGRSLSSGFTEAGLTDPITERLLKVGERTGQVQSILDVIARRYTQELETFIERLTRVIEPSLMIAVGLSIGGLIVLMYMPIFDLANGMQ